MSTPAEPTALVRLSPQPSRQIPSPGESSVSDVVSYEVKDRVALVTIERPQVKNAMSLEVFDGLRESAERAAEDDTVGAVLVSGRGGTFSSGIDTSVLAGQTDDGITLEFIHRLQSSFTAFEELDKPTIAAVEGHCFGAGFQLAIACHIRAVAPSARFSLMEVSWGLVPDLGATYRLPRLIGQGRATELALSGRVLPSDAAIMLGLGEIGLRKGKEQADAFEHVRSLANGPNAVSEIPRLMRENRTRDRDEALKHEAEAQVRCIEGPHFGEAVAAKLEKREPRFHG